MPKICEILICINRPVLPQEVRMMTKIEHIVGTGPELAESQQRVLAVLEKHSDHVFRMYGDDLTDLSMWATDPDLPSSPTVVKNTHLYSVNTIRWALHTLHERGKIASIVHGRTRYYGSWAAIENMKKAARQAGKEGMAQERVSKP
jgi:hypothetical protein